MEGKIRKRDGSLVPFEAGKITRAIEKAMASVGGDDPGLARDLSDEVVDRVKSRFPDSVPGVEDVQDEVERVLMAGGLPEVAKAYILYRQRRTDVREAKALLGIQDDLKLSVNAVKVLETRYLRRDDRGRVVETPARMFNRVANEVAKADSRYGPEGRSGTEERFLKAMLGLYFLPNSPTLMNAGTSLGQLSACYVVPVEDSMRSIFTAIRDMSLIHQSGGGTGFSFSKLRPAGDLVRSTKGIASGPVSFMRVFDVATDVVKQGGRRRGANMGILSVNHPDIVRFITAKESEGALTNFNLSVAVTDDFMCRVKQDREHDLVNPRNGEVTESVRARDIFDLIVSMAWRTGDPGIVFMDEINRHNPTPELGRIEATNPCGEVPLLPYESCTLGSINLSKVVKRGEVDTELLRNLTRTGVQFLDNVLDINQYPVRRAAEMAAGNRKIGLGVMGFAEMLIKLGIPYDSTEGARRAEETMRTISEEAERTSEELAEERGAFPNFDASIYSGGPLRRNATVTTIAPTGTISIIAGTSSGIEPLFAVAFVRNVMDTQLLEANSVFERMAREEGFYSKKLMNEIARSGSVQGMDEVPEGIRRLFVTASEIEPRWHVEMQAAFQKHVENAVSKTVNLPQRASLADVREVFDMAHRLKCKGVTVYRYGSRQEQVLYRGEGPAKAADSEYSGGCPTEECWF